VWVVVLRPVDGLGVLDAVGCALWLFGFGIEVMADAQKSAFRNNPDNRGRFISTGLWAWSRHPNYFGEIVLWTGLFLVSVSQLQGLEWLVGLSPVFVAGLLIAGSGIPLLEAAADTRWGSDPDYQRYKATTPVLVLRPPSS
jgi:steroid 5-alpha reductase family enzyme